MDAECAGATGTTLQVTRIYRRVGPDGRAAELLNPGRGVAVGEIIEVQLVVAASHACEYLLLTDSKPAGFETTESDSGYDWLTGAYVEFHDSEVRFFLETLGHKTTRFSYRLRAETPGQFLAKPTTIVGMYQPELCANSKSDTWVIRSSDAETRTPGPLP